MILRASEVVSQQAHNLLIRSSILRLATNGAIAQLGEHLICIQGVRGSIPLSSTIRGRLTYFKFSIFLLKEDQTGLIVRA